MSPASAHRPRVALVTYSTKPRGGVVHTLSLAEAMVNRGMPVTVAGLGDPADGFYRAVSAPHCLIPAPPRADILEERVFASVDALERGLKELIGEVDIVHTQDCISARAAARVRDSGAAIQVVRTVHHVDDFTTQALIECQRQAILEPDRLVVVSEDWRRRLRAEFGVEAEVIHNGVDASLFGPIDLARRAALRRDTRTEDRFTFLAVGGVEPRKGSIFLFQALAKLVAARQLTRTPPPAVVIVGGHSFQDYAEYRDTALAMLGDLGLREGHDVIQLGTVTDSRLREWYRSADALAFPSIKEGWGLAVLEAMSADLPVVASDIAVLREYLTDGADAVLTEAANSDDLAAGMRAVMVDEDLRQRLIDGGRAVVSRFTWDHAATAHDRLYRESR